MTEKRIKDLARAGKFEQAIEECESLLTSPGVDELEVLRARAYVYGKKGDPKKALDDHRAIVGNRLAQLADFYLAAYDALSFEDYEQARRWLHELMEQAESAGNDAYDAVAHFQIAYTDMQLGHYEQALESLLKAVAIDPDIAMPIPGESGIANSKDLQLEIERRHRAQ